MSINWTALSGTVETLNLSVCQIENTRNRSVLFSTMEEAIATLSTKIVVYLLKRLFGSCALVAMLVALAHFEGKMVIVGKLSY